MLMFIQVILCYRLLKLKLKEKDDLFLTNANGLLKLLPPAIENQRIKIHNRKLTFINYNSVYKFFLNNGSLEIKLRRVEEERHKIGFLRSGVKRRKVKPFGYLSKRQKMVPKDFIKNKLNDSVKKEILPRDTTIREEKTQIKEGTFKEGMLRDILPRDTTIREEKTQIKDTSLRDTSLRDTSLRDTLLRDTNKGNFLKKEETSYSPDDPPDHDEAEGEDETKQLEILKSLLANLENDSEVKTTKVKAPTVEKKDDSIINKLKQIFKKKHINEEVYIESDSKLEDETVTEQFIDVIVSSINKTYFKLKTATNNCVTFIDGMFIFAPCINIDNQIFMTVNEEEVRRKIKDSIPLISYEKKMRTKYKPNCDDYHQLCTVGSPRYSESTCKTLREECEDDSTDEESSEITPETRPLPLYPFRKPINSNINNNSNNNSNINSNINKFDTNKFITPNDYPIPSEPIIRTNTFKTDPATNTQLKPSSETNQPSKSSALPQQNKQSGSTSLKDIIKTEASKKDFSPDDIIEKLKKSIKSNDFSDLLS